jgi:hypothetical protein
VPRCALRLPPGRPAEMESLSSKRRSSGADPKSFRFTNIFNQSFVALCPGSRCQGDSARFEIQLYPRSTSGQKGDEKQHQKDEKQDFGYHRRRARQAKETKGPARIAINKNTSA